MNKMPSPNQAPAQHQDDEIDLWQIFDALWAGKLWVALFSILSIAAGIAYVFNAQEEWIAQARVTSPDYTEYQKIAQFTQALQPAFGNDFKNRLKELKFNDSEEVFNRFITTFNSMDNKLAFLKSSNTFSTQFTRTSTPEEGRKELRNWSSEITANTSTKESNDIYNLSVAGWSADSSYQLLQEYINFTNTKVGEDLWKNLSSLYNLRLRELEQSLQVLHVNTQAEVSSQIDLLTHTLAIANAAQVTSPIVDPGGDQDEFPINLGGRAIAAKIKELQNLKNLSIIEPAIRTTENQLAALKDVDLAAQPSFKSFQYLQEPEKPLNRESPKKLLILLGCMVFGGALGCIYVLLSQAIRSHISGQNTDK